MEDIEYSRQLQERFELYLLALTFTLLGLAVQTAKFGPYKAADALEILGWVSLATSGFAGLLRMEWVPVVIKTHSQLKPIRTEKTQFEQAAAAGVTEVPVVGVERPVPLESLIENRTTAIAAVDARLEKIERGILRKYTLHKWLFALGIVLLIAARAYAPVTAIFAGQTATAEACAAQTTGAAAAVASPTAVK